MMRLPRTIVPGLAALAVALGCVREAGEAVPPEAEGPPTEVVTLWSEHLELFMEYPALIAGRASEPWAIHLTRLEGFQAAMAGSVTLTFTGSGGEVHEATALAPTGPGIFGPSVELPSAGTYDLVLRYEGEGLREEIWVGPVYVYGSDADLPTVPPEPETGIVLLKEQQWVTPFGTAEVGERLVRESRVAFGEVTTPDGGRVEVPAPVGGVVTSALNSAAPSVGTRVRRGEVLAQVTSAEGESSWAALLARVEHLGRETARLERLYAAQAVPARRLEEARHEWTVARRALEALGDAADSGAVFRVRAPRDGIIVERYLVPGSRVDAGDPLFSVAGQGSVWARFQVPAAEAALLDVTQGATFTVEGSGEWHRAGRRVAASHDVDPLRRTLAITFEVPSPSGLLRPGMLLQGHLLVGDGVSGTAIPAEAIRMEDGVPVAYVQVGGELFQRRVLRLGGSDGQWTLVESGVDAGERVVVRGAYQVRLASLNPAAVSDHGHPH